MSFPRKRESPLSVAVVLLRKDDHCRDRALALSAVGNQGQWTDLKVCPYFREVAEKSDMPPVSLRVLHSGKDPQNDDEAISVGRPMSFSRKRESSPP